MTTHNAKSLPPLEVLARHISYDADTGIFKWLNYKRGCRRSLIAGTNLRGYISIKIDQNRYFAHRLAWHIAKGPIPEGIEIDHINRNPSDNRICNLRPATIRQNILNNGRPEEWQGTTFHKKAAKWQAQIEDRGRPIYLGIFETREEARAAYLLASKELTP